MSSGAVAVPRCSLSGVLNLGTFLSRLDKPLPCTKNTPNIRSPDSPKSSEKLEGLDERKSRELEAKK